VQTGDKSNKRAGDIGNSFMVDRIGLKGVSRGIVRVQADRDRSL
jgi:hypothetical protein